MGMFDTISVPCPRCGLEHGFQTKSGPCLLLEFRLGQESNSEYEKALHNVNRHAPWTCTECGCIFAVDMVTRKPVELRTMEEHELYLGKGFHE